MTLLCLSSAQRDGVSVKRSRQPGGSHNPMHLPQKLRDLGIRQRLPTALYGGVYDYVSWGLKAG